MGSKWNLLLSAIPSALGREISFSLRFAASCFQNVFGERLVTKFLFESDFSEDPQLPSPAQLKYRILIKNKKLREPDNPLALKKVSLVVACSHCPRMPAPPAFRTQCVY